jgi:hypothetical protein
MTKRSEASQFLSHEAILSVSAVNNPIGSDAYQEMETRATKTRGDADGRTASSNRYRRAGLVIYSMSVGAFVVGCALGAIVVLVAKAHA